MKNLIIVCEEKYRFVGAYILQLISSDDDTESKVIGTKDGEVEATLWAEKEYKSNSMQISSEQYMLFIGSSKDIKMQCSNMKTVFSKYEMKYAFLGKQAVLCVDNPVPFKEYSDFFEYSKKYSNEIQKNLVDKKKIAKTVAIEAGLLLLGGLLLSGTFSMIAYRRKIKEIKKQQYCCLATKFYLEELSKFLGL